MSLVSTTLAGPRAEQGLQRALESIAPHVDRCIVLDTAREPRAALTECLGAAADKTIVEHWPWRDDFGAARNAALEAATKRGATWAVHVDDDEWIEAGADVLARVMRSVDEKAFHMFNGTRQYLQPRVIRLPCAQQWRGRVHEAIEVKGPALEHARFCEEPKTPWQARKKAIRDEIMLRRLVEEEPETPRWRYYLAEAVATQERWQEAVDLFVSRAQMNGWSEEAAWACARAGEILSLRLHRHDDALELFAAGMARHAGVAELPWQAAMACARKADMQQAAYWAELAKVHGARGAAGSMALNHRVLWRVPKALCEGPDELLAHVYRALGMEERAAAAEASAKSWAAP